MSQLDEFKNGKTSASGSFSEESSQIKIIEFNEQIQRFTSFTNLRNEGVTVDFRSLRERLNSVKVHNDELFMDDPDE